jgi:hypothetical protein
VVVFAHPLACGEGLEESAVEAARGAIVDVLDGRGLPKLGGGQTAGERAVIGEGNFAIDSIMRNIEGWYLNLPLWARLLVEAVLLGRPPHKGSTDRRGPFEWDRCCIAAGLALPPHADCRSQLR